MSKHAVQPQNLQAQFQVPEAPIQPQDHIWLLGQTNLVAAIKLALKQPQKNKQHVYVMAEYDMAIERILCAYFNSYERDSLSQKLVVDQSHDSLTYSWRLDAEEEAVVVQEMDYHYYDGAYNQANLFGRFIDRNEEAHFVPGALFKYSVVVLSIEHLHKHHYVWRKLLHSLVTGYVELHENYPPLPLNCLVILQGDYENYAFSKEIDPKFVEAFSFFTESVSEFKYHPDTVSGYHTWLATIAKQLGIELAIDSYPILMRFSSSLMEHQLRFSLEPLKIQRLLRKAALFSEHAMINAKHVEQAIRYLHQQHGGSQQRSLENFIDNFVYIATEGARAGQINALTVIEDAFSTYGEPARVTATVHYGDGEVADIERKSDLGGNIHAKGMMILSACLYRIFGKDEALHLNASIVFEQSYQEIDGDSASLAEYCALISAIADVPILQSLAVTGAIDQFGYVQAIGGVNEKIISFFELCRYRGLTGEQGVIIPSANVIQLNLPKHLIQAIETGNFNIYQVSHVDQAIEMLTQIKPGVMDEYHLFPEESLYGKVQSRLAMLAEGDAEEESFFKRVLQKVADFFH